MNITLQKLESLNLQTSTLDEVYKLIYEGLKYVVFVTKTLKKGTYIERSRLNEKTSCFFSESEISYRKDSNKIIKFGRANLPKQSMFYGAVDSKHFKTTRAVNLYEISEIFKSGYIPSQNQFKLTTGKWRLKEDIEVVEIIFNKNNIANIPQVKETYKQHIDNLSRKFPDNINEIQSNLEFFSNQFSKKDITHDKEYMLTAIYADIATNQRGYAGVLYPSVRTENKGLNIAIRPSIVDKYLDLEKVILSEIVTSEKLIQMIGIATSVNFGKENKKFSWKENKRGKEIVIKATNN